MSVFAKRGMFALGLFALVLGGISLRSVRVSAEGTCPDTGQGETAEDCPWAGYARALQVVAAAGGSVTLEARKIAPELVRSLEADQARDEWKELWGQSINFDELAKGIIVDPAILEALGEVMDVELPGLAERHVHAGLEHTYGYLFSTLKTSFGYKRARWVRADIENGFGLSRGLLGPTPSEGTLFSNVTYFAGRIAFAGNANQLEVLAAEDAGVPGELKALDYASLKISRLREAFSPEPGRQVVLATDLVRFPKVALPPPGNAGLLVYSVLDTRQSALPVLITAFPVSESFIAAALDPANLGEGKPIVTRYNAYLPDVSGKTFTGLRYLSGSGETP
jgi:hypothetical protein